MSGLRSISLFHPFKVFPFAGNTQARQRFHGKPLGFRLPVRLMRPIGPAPAMSGTIVEFDVETGPGVRNSGSREFTS